MNGQRPCRADWAGFAMEFEVVVVEIHGKLAAREFIQASGRVTCRWKFSEAGVHHLMSFNI